MISSCYDSSPCPTVKVKTVDADFSLFLDTTEAWPWNPGPRQRLHCIAWMSVKRGHIQVSRPSYYLCQYNEYFFSDWQCSVVSVVFQLWGALHFLLPRDRRALPQFCKDDKSPVDVKRTVTKASNGSWRYLVEVKKAVLTALSDLQRWLKKRGKDHL